MKKRPRMTGYAWMMCGVWLGYFLAFWGGIIAVIAGVVAAAAYVVRRIIGG